MAYKMNQVHDYRFGPIASLIEVPSWLTVDPGSKMAPGESRALQDDYYKTPEEGLRRSDMVD